MFYYKLAPGILAILLVLFGFVATSQAQIVPAQNQQILAPYGGFIVATSSSGTSKLSATTSPYFATFTFGQATGTVMALNTLCLISDSCRTTWPTGTITGSGSAGQVAYFTNATNLASVATGTVSGTGGVTVTANRYVVGGNMTIDCTAAGAASTGCLSSTDWNTFNNKQPAGNYITDLTGDGTATGPGSAAFTLATVNSNVGSFTNANITVNAKGLITAASNGAASGAGAVSTSSAETDTYIPFWTSNAATPALLSGGASTFRWLSPGLLALASTTIGDGTTGLTVSGTGTTTGLAYFATGVGIGTNPPTTAMLSVATSSPITSSLSTFSGTVTGSTATAFMTGLSVTGTINQSVSNTATANGGAYRNRYIVTNASAGQRVAELSSIATSYVINGALASTTNAAGIEVLNPSSGAGTVTDNFQGLWVRGGAQTGTFTNRYGLRIDALTGGTNRWGISQEGSSDLNYFAGNTGIGTTTPWAKLSIAGESLGTTRLISVSTSTAVATNTVFSIDANGNTSIGTNGTVLAIGGATTTSANGIDLAAGCFAIGGTCIQTGAGAITALTGDVTATGPGSVPATLATVNANVGSFTLTNLTVNGKGLITAASSYAGASCTNQFIRSLNGAGAATCATVQNTDLANSTIGLSDAASSLTIGGSPASLGGALTATLNLSHSNGWQVLQNFTNASTSQFTATSSVWFTSLATPAGTFLAVDNNGKLIATTTPGGSSTPGGSDTQVQFNNNGAFAGDSGFVFASTTDLLTVTNASTTNTTVSNSFHLPFLGGTAGVLINNTSNKVTNAGATTCTNQFVRAMSAAYVATCQSVSLTADVTGTLPIANGGTNNSSAYTAGSVIFSNGTILTQDNTNLFWDDTNNRLGVGSTTPWAKLSIVATSTETDSSIPVFATVGGTAVDEQYAVLFATSTAAGVNGTKGRFNIGYLSTYGDRNMIDPLTVNGPISTLDWFELQCAGTFGNFSGTITSDSVFGCGDFAFGEDGTATALISTTNGVPLFRMTSGAAADGAILSLPAAANGTFSFATSTPRIEGKMSMISFNASDASTTAVYLGMMNRGPLDSNLELAPSRGCYLTASTTEANWKAVCQSAGGITITDTGVATSSANTYLRVQGDANAVDFYVQPKGSVMKSVRITTTIPTDSLFPSVYFGRVTAGGSSGLIISSIRFWYSSPLQ